MGRQVALTPKACELLDKMQPKKLYRMSDMGDLIFDSPCTHSRQTIALKGSRFVRQLLDEFYVSWNADNLYYLTDEGIKEKGTL